MDFELDVGQRAWLTGVREFLHDNVTAELRAELAQHDLEFPDGEVARSQDRRERLTSHRAPG
jgi:3-oxocholest-4-en-26-oyl-CoA dehydrogenase alpha subunit